MSQAIETVSFNVVDSLCSAYIEACKSHDQSLAASLWKSLESAMEEEMAGMSRRGG